jgi:DNA phosphorothioation system restriction enzyme
MGRTAHKVVLSDLTLKQSYRSDEDNLVDDFYAVCLALSTRYDRAVGFYSSSALAVAAAGLHACLSGGGHMRLVASPHLSPQDIEDIEKGYRNRRAVEEQAVIAVLEGDFDDITCGRLGLLAWLIASDRLDVKIAVPRSARGNGIYHEKLGVFSDGKNYVAFSGSPNESATALATNFECIDVFCSWKHEDAGRARTKCENFSKLWNDRTSSLAVYPFSEAARRSLLRYKPASQPVQDPAAHGRGKLESPDGCPRVPAEISLRDYQVEAVDNWFAAKGRGVFKMATGSGKTITALATAARLHAEIGLQALLVIAPYRHLVTQWSKECERFGLHPIRCYESRQIWQEKLQASLLDVQAGALPFVCAITTNATFTGVPFQDLLQYFPERSLIIGDEVHNLGAQQLAQSLPPRIGLRLGLSATPERWFDEEGTDDIFAYFGQIIRPEFTLKDAVHSGALVPYKYYPVFVSLTEEEGEEYIELSRKLARALAGKKADGALSDAAQMLLFRRSRLIGSAANKIVRLREIMSDRLETDHTLFYCGDGSVEKEVSGDMERHIEAVSAMLGADLGYRVAKYTADTSLLERADLTDQLDSGELQGLVAIRCLDEGVDIPSITTAFILASSTNPRQFIQRRGRVLRRYPGKEMAEIFDFLVVPPDSGLEDHGTERRLLRRELQRYAEFADLALNGGEVRGQLVELQRKYGLLSL